MTQVVIENPVINSPYIEPRRHYRFDEDGITDQIVEVTDLGNAEQTIRATDGGRVSVGDSRGRRYYGTVSGCYAG